MVEEKYAVSTAGAARPTSESFVCGVSVRCRGSKQQYLEYLEFFEHLRDLTQFCSTVKGKEVHMFSRSRPADPSQLSATKTMLCE